MLNAPDLPRNKKVEKCHDCGKRIEAGCGYRIHKGDLAVEPLYICENCFQSGQKLRPD